MDLGIDYKLFFVELLREMNSKEISFNYKDRENINSDRPCNIRGL